MESWSQVRIFHEGDAFYESLLQSIRSAQQSITIECYIFSVDKLTEQILQELGMAKIRGCHVKIVVDGFGSYNSIPQLAEICEKKGIELRVFHPLPYLLMRKRKVLAKFSSGPLYLLKRFNQRTHRKVVIIDEKRAYLGSLNFDQIHCESLSGSQAWRDTGVWVEGPPVQKLVLAFQISYFRTILRGLIGWVGRWQIKGEPFQDHLRLNTTPRMRRRLYKNLLQRISTAQNRIYITTAYFLPKGSLLRALVKAARRGVDVQILIPGKSDVPLVKWAAFSLIRLLIERQIRIYEYQKSILHAKSMIIDNETFIGSANFNHRSVMHDLEVEVVLDDKASLENMLQQWQIDLENSKLASAKDFSSTWWVTRWLYQIAFRLRYML